MEHIGRAGAETKWPNQPMITAMCGKVHTLAMMYPKTMH